MTERQRNPFRAVWIEMPVTARTVVSMACVLVGFALAEYGAGGLAGVLFFAGGVCLGSTKEFTK